MASPGLVLVTGGAGFIGSHICLNLLEHGYEVVVVDDFSTGSPTALDRVAKLAGRPVTQYRLDLRDRSGLRVVFDTHPVDVVIHLAAKKAVGESVCMPLTYYDVNVCGMMSLLEAVHEHRVPNFLFSSSCSIYGSAQRVPIGENDPPAPTNPYARSKWMCEQMLADACERYTDLRAISLRYFNPIGAHDSGLLGESPRTVPNNLVPYLAQVAVGRRQRLDIFGNDYPTADGTAIRDYIHILDLVEGHRVALDHIDDEAGMRIFNLGTGVGTSVLQLVRTFSEVCGKALPYRFAQRRPGDVAALVADPARVAQSWNWRTKRDLETMCCDAWNFQQLHPAGYDG